ncbi:uncharacterized protein TrAtP1_007899 [Trichoderma atroviride]|uniref:uncharacterized protein n=1 Tax=Hypocrea atroviridis TaxID=63577 RepID=UPI00331EA557|nr:hypothetical protein TrAtP1_007899 [Trichoderma atroviride]
MQPGRHPLVSDTYLDEPKKRDDSRNMWARRMPKEVASSKGPRYAHRRTQPPIRGTRPLQVCSALPPGAGPVPITRRDREGLLAVAPHCHGHRQPCVGASLESASIQPNRGDTQLANVLPALDWTRADDKRSLAGRARAIHTYIAL